MMKAKLKRAVSCLQTYDQKKKMLRILKFQNKKNLAISSMWSHLYFISLCLTKVETREVIPDEAASLEQLASTPKKKKKG